MTLTDYVHDCAAFSWRILIVENDQSQRADQIETLHYWGYEVFTTEIPSDVDDVYQSLQEEAIKKARAYHCHIVLIDLRLISDANKRDVSGAELVREFAKELPLLHIIIWSGYKLLLFSLPPTVHWCYVGKEEGPETLKSTIEATIEQIRLTQQVLEE